LTSGRVSASVRFEVWTSDEWATCGLSAYWDVEEGVVLWAEGGRFRDQMPEVGLPIEEFIEARRHKA